MLQHTTPLLVDPRLFQVLASSEGAWRPDPDSALHHFIAALEVLDEL
jgi:hypothetical protein